MMKITEQVHQIRIDFQVTETVRRYVYIYLITGEFCYLVDTGVAGSDIIIEQYMNSLGRNLREIKAVFLTHSHPDHIGGAAAIKERSGCRIYASEKECSWIEDIEYQYNCRPIPNFHKLVQQPVPVDHVVREGDCMIPEENIRINVLETEGHSYGDLTFYLNHDIIFSGDAIPADDDFPIFINFGRSLNTLDNLYGLESVRYCCPAWDTIYTGNEIKKVIYNRKQALLRLKTCIQELLLYHPEYNDDTLCRMAAAGMGWQGTRGNPLFAKSIAACRQTLSP